MTQGTEAFHVDLRGLVDLLSQHLYSSPRVYLRELVQNALDAITARAEQDPGCPRRIQIVPADLSSDGCLHLSDTGIGLDESGIREVLATIGASSKRDELGFARDSFLGQFGIGLLACFLVTDEIRLITRRVGSPETCVWVGRASGEYTVHPAQGTEVRDEPGTEVILRPRDRSGLLDHDSVVALAASYAAYLPVAIEVTDAQGTQRLGGRTFPWADPTLTGSARPAAAREVCRELLGFDPLDLIELCDPISGVRGFAYVTPQPAGTRAHHRVYAKGMLVSEALPGILPDWAFFVRAIVDGERLELTASRESLQDGEALAQTRQRLGEALTRWLSRTAQTDPQRLRRFLRVHHLGAKAMAAQDEQMLEVVADLLPWETSAGEMSLAEFAALAPVIRYAATLEDFRQIAPLAQVSDLPVLNAGYAYDQQILARWVAAHPQSDSRSIRPSELGAAFEDLGPAEAGAFEPLLAVAAQALARAGVEVLVRRFQPTALAAVLLVDRQAAAERDRVEVAELLDGDGPWAQLLEVSARPHAQAAFVLNADNLSVLRLAQHPDAWLQRTVLEALYAHALVSGHHPLRAFDAALVARALPALIDRALDGPTTRGSDS